MKKLISLCAVLCLMLSLCSVTAFADEEEVNAEFDFNGIWYWIGSDNVPHTVDDGDESSTALPDGVSYDYASNTLTLNGATLTHFRSDYSGWDEKNGWQYQNLPIADLTIVLEGENAIVNPAGGVNGNYHAIEFDAGVNVTIQGSGSLTVEAQNTAEDEWVGRALTVSGHSSLTVTDSAHVTAKVTGESCNVTEEDSWTDFIAIDGDWNTDCELTVSENATLEAYGDCGGIQSIDITAKDNATIKANLIRMQVNTPEQAEANKDEAEIEEGLEPRVMTVEDNAVVDIKTSYETEIEGCYEALVLEAGCKLLVKGGTVNVTQDSGVTEWSDGDTGIGMWFDSDLYDVEKNADMLPSIVVSGGELNVTSSFVGIQMSGGELDVSGGVVNVASTTSQFGIYAYGPSGINLSGGSLNAETAGDGSGVAVFLTFGDETRGLTVTGGEHCFGSEELTSETGLVIFTPFSFTGGTTKLYGSTCALQSSAWQWFDEDPDNSLDPKNLPIEESELVCPFTLGDDMVATDAATGEELTLGTYDHVWTGEDEDVIHGYEYDRYYSYTADGSAELQVDEDVNFLNCATGIAIAEAPVVNPFVDVADDAFYHDAVLWAVKKAVTSGTGADTFSPDNICTRGEAVTFLWRAAGSPAPTDTANPFTDVSDDAYYHDAVLWAVENGITSGVGNGVFGADVVCQRDQIVTFLYRYAGSPAVSGSGSFTDVSDGAYYAAAAQWAVERGVTNGTSETTFSPEADCTRSQIVTFLYRYLAN